MRLSQFLLLVTLTCIACNNIVASSKGLIQVKTLDAYSQRELTDRTRRKLRGGVENDGVAAGEERSARFNGVFEGQGNKVAEVVESLETKRIDIANVKKATLWQKVKAFFEKIRHFFAKRINKMKGKTTDLSPKVLQSEKKATPTESTENSQHRTSEPDSHVTLQPTNAVDNNGNEPLHLGWYEKTKENENTAADLTNPASTVSVEDRIKKNKGNLGPGQKLSRSTSVQNRDIATPL